MFFNLAAATPAALFPIMNSIAITQHQNQITRSKSIETITSQTSNIEAQYKQACEIVKHLPKNGSYQLSNELLLKFYGYYKQVTCGPCTRTKPSIFKVVECAKWDAWYSVRNLNKYSAMEGYISEVKNIIDTLPYNEHVEKFHELTEVSEQETIIEKQKSNVKDNELINQNSFKCIETSQSDDDEDYCDTASEIIISENDLIKDLKKQSFNKAFNGKNDKKDLENLIYKCGGETTPSNSNSSYYHQSVRQSRPGSSQSVNLNGRLTNQRSSFSGGGGGGGGGGYNPPPNENFLQSSYLNQDSNRQIMLILLRLQQDTNNVIARLSYLEANLISLTNSLHINRMENNYQMNNQISSAFSLVNSGRTRSNCHKLQPASCFSDLFANIDLKTITIAFLWPLIIRLLWYFVRKIKLFRKLKQIRHEFGPKF